MRDSHTQPNSNKSVTRLVEGNEFTVEVETDSQALTLLVKYAADETAKLYGPIFSRMAAEHAARFEAEQLGEEPPKNIQTLDDATDYILRNLDKYPQGLQRPDVRHWKNRSKPPRSNRSRGKKNRLQRDEKHNRKQRHPKRDRRNNPRHVRSHIQDSRTGETDKNKSTSNLQETECLG